MQQILQNISSLMKAKKVDDAEKLCEQLVKEFPDQIEGWLHLGWISQLKTDFPKMLTCGERASQINPNSVAALMIYAEASLCAGKIASSFKTLSQLEHIAPNDGLLWSKMAQFYTKAGEFEASARCYNRAHEIMGDDPQALYNCAAASLALGKMDEAENFYDRVVDLNPNDYDVYYNRAGLRKQTTDNNHIEQMTRLLDAGIADPAGAAPVHYALAKEYEDMGDHKKSISSLLKGAEVRASSLSYTVQDDVDTMRKITEFMTADVANQIDDSELGEGRIFVLGLPRSGTTLMERIISSQPQVESLGEIHDLVASLTNTVGKVTDKADLIAKSTTMDFAAMGKRYMSSTTERSQSDAPVLLDKMTANFLYVGWIARALPKAKIIHLKRNPMDSCYAMYKTLFRMGYPFSYNQENLGLYFAAYRGLMDHWHNVLPGHVFDVQYEELVSDPEATSRGMFEYLGLEWDRSVLDFHKSKAPVATASAAQVRQPIYKTSVEKWRHYESELAPLKAILEDAGIAV